MREPIQTRCLNDSKFRAYWPKTLKWNLIMSENLNGDGGTGFGVGEGVMMVG